MFLIVHIVTNQTHLKTKLHCLSLPLAAVPTPPSTPSEDLGNHNIPPLPPDSHSLCALPEEDQYQKCAHQDHLI